MQLVADGLFAFFHEPFGCGRCAANAYCAAVAQQVVVDFVCAVDYIRVGVDGTALSEEHPAVGAFFTADEEDSIVLSGKLSDVLHAVCGLSADSVVVAERCVGIHAFAYFVYYLTEAVERLGGLRIETDVFIVIKFVQVVGRFYDDGIATCLPHETEHFGVTVFPVDYNLFVFEFAGVVFFFDAFLQVKYDGARSIDEEDMVVLGGKVSFWRFAVGAQEDFYVVQAGESGVVDGNEP